MTSLTLVPPSPASKYGALSPTAAPATAGASWKEQILSQVATRQRQQLAFTDIFTAYARVMAHAGQLKQRVFQLEQEVMTTRHLSSLTATPGAADRTGGMRSTRGSVSDSVTPTAGGGGANITSAQQKLLEDKILKLQEDLTAAYRLQSENSHTSLRLKEQAAADEKALLRKEEELAEKTRQVQTLQTTLATEREATKQRHKTLEQTTEMLRAELQGSRAQAKSQETKLSTLVIENDQLLTAMIKLREEQAEKGSEIASIKQELARASALAVAAADAKKQAEEGRAIAPTAVDLTDMEAVIEHVQWSSTCTVEIPSERKRTIRGHRGAATCARYNTAGTLLASAGLDGLVKIYDARTGTNRASLRGSKEGIMNVCFSHNDELLLASGNDNISRLWSLRSSKVVHTLVGHTAKVWAASLTADGEKAITGSHDRTLRIWDVKEGSGTAAKQIKCFSSCNYLSVNKSDSMIASAHLDTHVRIWSVHTGELMRDLDDVHDGQVTSVEWNKDGTQIVTNSRDSVVRIIDTRTYKVLFECLQSSKVPYRNLINWNRAVWSPDDKHVMAGGAAGDCFFWSADTGRLEAILAGVQMQDGIYGSAPAASAGSSLSFAASPAAATAGGSAASASSAAAVAAANAVSESSISCVDWNRNGRQTMSADNGGNLHIWENELVKMDAPKS